MSKRVLLISKFFAPHNKIGAVRSTKLAKYLLRMGYEVTVLCWKDISNIRDPLLARDLEQIPNVHIVRERSLLRWWKERCRTSEATGLAAKENTIADQPSLLRTALYLYLADRADAAFARACIREAKRTGHTYDVVLTTYGPLSAHIIGRQVKRLGIAKHWIADFRDETTVPFAWQKPKLKRYHRMVLRHADCITAASAGYLRVMGMEHIGHVVYNGFDRDDLAGFDAPLKRTDKLAFVHCGQMYGSQRDLSPFFRALSELIGEGEIPVGSVALVYTGWDTYAFVTQATDAGLSDCLEGYGFVPRDESLRLQKAAHVLLLPAWNLKEKQGNIPGKVFEYMMLEMPVICCVSGEIPRSEIAGIIHATNIGTCYEQDSRQVDYPRLKAYIRSMVKAFLNGDAMPFTPNRDAISEYSSESMVQKIRDIIEEWA